MITLEDGTAIDPTIRYDQCYRMMYHPDYHENHGKPFTDSDLEYMCKYAEVDSLETLAFALG